MASIKVSRLHLVDLAGSERQKDTHAEGLRLKVNFKCVPAVVLSPVWYVNIVTSLKKVLNSSDGLSKFYLVRCH